MEKEELMLIFQMINKRD